MSDTSASKFLSLILRHNPGEIGLTLDPGGWASVAEIVARSGGRLNETAIRRIAATSDKQRFALSPNGSRIRANQGHSIPVDLGLTPQEPPGTLWHGTATRFLVAILDEGLKPMSRQHVHLSPDTETARKVGQRHGKPVILTVAAGQMHAQGHAFLLSENGVWLTGHVPRTYIHVAD